jgi:exoribonuclease R
LGRIGTIVAPFVPAAKSGRVWIGVERGGKRQFEPVMDFGSAQGYVWEIGPVRKGNSWEWVYVTSRSFVDALIRRLDDLEKERHDLAGEISERARALKNFDTCADLVRPMPAGARGEGRVVEILKSTKPGSVGTPRSKSDVVVQTYSE